MMVRDKTVAVYTLGCKVNQQESQAILDEMRRRGWRSVGFDQPAALYIVNTCTVTQAADQKSRKMIRGAKKNNRQALLAVIGCYAESDGAALREIEGIDLILGNREKEGLPAWADEVWRRRWGQPGAEEAPGAGAELRAGGTGEAPGAVAELGAGAGIAPGAVVELGAGAGDTPGFVAAPWVGAGAESGAGAAPTVKGLDRARAGLKIQDGCRQFCSYCVIPYVRGEWRSLDEAAAVAQTERLAAAGCREIVLLGIHLGAYGWETGRRDQLAGLLRLLLESYPGLRFRLGSLEPMEASPALIGLLRDYPNACKHLHLPLQSGQDRVLKAMNRPYGTADYRAKVAEIRREIPSIALTTDIMAGFPGETAAEFEAGLAFIAGMAFSRLHVFAYSRRPGTAAAALPGQVPRAIKEERCRELAKLDADSRRRYGQSWAGRRQWALAEEEIAPGVWSGHCDNYLEATFAIGAAQTAGPADQVVGGAAGDEAGGQAGRPAVRGSLFPILLTGEPGAKAGSWAGILAPE
ncbi:MAG: tRNA (N(6)-L-threonylcarbamoyladenosine(37)-C(2))-methylthiotransferase MtaB [Peptococcaceae bacterium]|jgi:threonylcarbamoyladenosine tRNA methylthiotransferase MtaB|nr:tRNA (N(6)-L-threonylcarbamoyladenosine(37)-C(2))-methylthiotransferase MtaB [Peptococcaceae bacterium]